MINYKPLEIGRVSKIIIKYNKIIQKKRNKGNPVTETIKSVAGNQVHEKCLYIIICDWKVYFTSVAGEVNSTRQRSTGECRDPDPDDLIIVL